MAQRGNIGIALPGGDQRGKVCVHTGIFGAQTAILTFSVDARITRQSQIGPAIG